MEQAYARALWAMVARGTEPRRAVHTLEEHLKVRGREALMPKIVWAFERLAAEEAQRSAVTLSVAREKDAHAAKREVKEILAPLGIDEREVEVDLDETLIGGWRLEGRGVLVDASFKKSLLDVYNRAVN